MQAIGMFDKYVRSQLDCWSRSFPILDWGWHYRRECLAGDLTAGIVVGTVLIPQAMAPQKNLQIAIANITK
jgi:MFS superfamily sulfate permease-like transporter